MKTSVTLLSGVDSLAAFYWSKCEYPDYLHKAVYIDFGQPLAEDEYKELKKVAPELIYEKVDGFVQEGTWDDVNPNMGGRATVLTAYVITKYKPNRICFGFLKETDDWYYEGRQEWCAVTEKYWTDILRFYDEEFEIKIDAPLSKLDWSKTQVLEYLDVNGYDISGLYSCYKEHGPEEFCFKCSHLKLAGIEANVKTRYDDV